MDSNSDCESGTERLIRCFTRGLTFRSWNAQPFTSPPTRRWDVKRKRIKLIQDEWKKDANKKRSKCSMSKQFVIYGFCRSINLCLRMIRMALKRPAGP